MIRTVGLPISSICLSTMTWVVYGYRSVIIWGGATGSDVTGCDVSHVTGSDPVRKYVLRMHNRKLRHIALMGPEVALTGSRFCACPAFPPRFFLSSSTMITGCDQRSLDPFGVPLGMRNRKLCNTGSSSKQCWLGCSLRRPRPITIGNPTSYI